MEEMRVGRAARPANRCGRHGMYMYAMRYRPEQCGGNSVERFLDAVRAEGAPLYRLYVATISNQPAFRKIAERRAEYLRVLPTPVANDATLNTVYIPHHVFLGSAADMRDIAAAVRKVEAALGGTRP